MALRKFIAAATSGDLELVKTLLKNDDQSELLHGTDNAGNTALICACANGREKVVRYLLEKGANLDFGNDYKWTALMTASYWGHEAIVGILLQNNCNANIANRYHCTPLSCAARRNHIQVADLLLSKGADVNINERLGLGHTPLMTAVQHGHDSMVELLLMKGANVNYKDPLTGWTPLMLAALNGHTTAAQILIKHGANCNDGNNLDNTALDIAKRRKRKDVENILDSVTILGVRNSGIPVDINIVEAARQGNLERISELSKMNDFNVNETSEDGITPLMCAAALNHLEVVQLLIEQKAEINLRDKTKGWTALIYATKYSHRSIICYLIMAGADVQLKTFCSHTSLDFALYNGETDVIRILAAGNGMPGSIFKQNYVKKMYKEAILAERKPVNAKYNSQDIQVSEIYDTNKGLKVLVSKGLNKLRNFNRTVRGLNKKPTQKARSFQPSLNDLSGRYQINVDSVKNSNILSENITFGEQSTASAVLKSAMIEGIDQKKATHLPLAGPSSNLWTNDLSDPVVPLFTPTTVLDFNKTQRDSVESLSASPQVPVVFLNGSIRREETLKAKKPQFNQKLIHESGFYSFNKKNNGQLSPASNDLLNQDEQSPESSFSFSMAGNSPNSSFTSSTNTRDMPSRKRGWNPVNVPSQSENNRQFQASSLTSCSPTSTTSTSPTYHYLVPKTSKSPSKRKSNSLPRIGRGSVVPLYNPRGSVKSEPDDEEMKQLLAKLSLEKYSPIFEEHEVDIESFVTLDEADLDEIGIDQDDAKEQILAAVQQLKKQKERKNVLLQTEAWS